MVYEINVLNLFQCKNYKGNNYFLLKLINLIEWINRLIARFFRWILPCAFERRPNQRKLIASTVCTQGMNDSYLVSQQNYPVPNQNIPIIWNVYFPPPVPILKTEGLNIVPSKGSSPRTECEDEYSSQRPLSEGRGSEGN